MAKTDRITSGHARFVGATAFITHGRPYDSGWTLNTHRRYLNIRMVWEAGAFMHSGMVYAPSEQWWTEAALQPPGPLRDGPRCASLVTVDETRHRSWDVGAIYREVGANPVETLLFGRWPDPAQS